MAENDTALLIDAVAVCTSVLLAPLPASKVSRTTPLVKLTLPPATAVTSLLKTLAPAAAAVPPPVGEAAASIAMVETCAAAFCTANASAEPLVASGSNVSKSTPTGKFSDAAIIVDAFEALLPE